MASRGDSVSGAVLMERCVEGDTVRPEMGSHCQCQVTHRTTLRIYGSRTLHQRRAEKTRRGKVRRSAERETRGGNSGLRRLHVAAGDVERGRDSTSRWVQCLPPK